jgi:hypothetical protein
VAETQCVVNVDHQREFADYDKAIELSPQFASAYPAYAARCRRSSSTSASGSVTGSEHRAPRQA